MSIITNCVLRWVKTPIIRSFHVNWTRVHSLFVDPPPQTCSDSHVCTAASVRVDWTIKGSHLHTFTSNHAFMARQALQRVYQSVSILCKAAHWFTPTHTQSQNATIPTGLQFNRALMTDTLQILPEPDLCTPFYSDSKHYVSDLQLNIYVRRRLRIFKAPPHLLMSVSLRA